MKVNKSMCAKKPMLALVRTIRDCAQSINVVMKSTDDELVQDMPSLAELEVCGKLIANSAHTIDETPWRDRVIMKGGAK